MAKNTDPFVSAGCPTQILIPFSIVFSPMNPSALNLISPAEIIFANPRIPSDASV